MNRGFLITLIWTLIGFGCNNERLIAPFEKDGKWGVVNGKGEIILDPKYASIEIPGKLKNEDLIKVEDFNGKTGYIDFSGKEIIPLIYDRGTSFSEGYAFVCSEGSYPIMVDIQGNGKELEGIMMVSRLSEGLAVFQKARRYGFLDKNGAIEIAPQYLSAKGFRNGLAAVKCDNCNTEDLENSTKGLWGFIDEKGDFKIEAQFEDAYFFDENGRSIVKKNGEYFFIDISGKRIFERSFDQVFAFSDKKAKVKMGDKFGFIDLSGEQAIPFLYQNATDFHEGYASVQLTDGTWGVIDQTGKFLIQPIYDELGTPFNGMVFYEKGEKMGIMKIESQKDIFNGLDGYYKNTHAELIIGSCFRNYNKVVDDIFSKDSFPFIPVIVEKGMGGIKSEIEANWDYVPMENGAMSQKEIFISENAKQDLRVVVYDGNETLDKRSVFLLASNFKMPVFNSEDVESIIKGIVDKVNSYQPLTKPVEVNINPEIFDSSLYWEFPNFYLAASYKWDFLGNDLEDSFLIEIRVESK